MGLHISRIEIRNFRNLRHLVIEDFPAHAVIVGDVADAVDDLPPRPLLRIPAGLGLAGRDGQ